MSYNSRYTGTIIDDAVELVKDNECKVKWANINIGSPEDNTALTNTFVFKNKDENIGGIKTFSNGAIFNEVSKSATPSSSSNSTDIATTAWVTSKVTSTDNNAVHKSGEETIGGVKTFSSPQVFIGSSTFGTGNTATFNGSATFNGTTTFNGTAVAGAALASGDNSSRVATTAWVNTADCVVHKTGNETISGNKTFSGNVTLSGTTTGVTPAANDNSTKLATTAWINGATNGIVHKTGDETISGGKTFTGGLYVLSASPYVLEKMNGITKGTAPSSNHFSGVLIFDNNGTATANRLGAIGTYYLTTGGTSTRLYAYNPTLSSTANEYVGITYNKDGSYYTYAPTPADGDSSSKIATTAFVKTYMTSNKNYTTTSVVKTEDITDDTPQLLRWYRKYADGWVEQGGLCQSYNRTITLPVKMKNTNYTVLATRYNRVGDYHPAGAYSKTTTTVIFKSSGDNGGTWRVHWYICGYAA